MVHNLGADTVIDYREDNADSKIIAEGPYVCKYFQQKRKIIKFQQILLLITDTV